ncbi:hypothetical protein OIU76_001339 [Salix suchowensis]|nr:hypothetical protein OIU76_001339 [Salix suchowensis]
MSLYCTFMVGYGKYIKRVERDTRKHAVPLCKAENQVAIM